MARTRDAVAGPQRFAVARQRNADPLRCARLVQAADDQPVEQHAMTGIALLGLQHPAFDPDRAAGPLQHRRGHGSTALGCQPEAGKQSKRHDQRITPQLATSQRQQCRSDSAGAEAQCPERRFHRQQEVDGDAAAQQGRQPEEPALAFGQQRGDRAEIAQPCPAGRPDPRQSGGKPLRQSPLRHPCHDRNFAHAAICRQSVQIGNAACPAGHLC